MRAELGIGARSAGGLKGLAPHRPLSSASERRGGLPRRRHSTPGARAAPRAVPWTLSRPGRTGRPLRGERLSTARRSTTGAHAGWHGSGQALLRPAVKGPEQLSDRLDPFLDASPPAESSGDRDRLV
jgi:hypothetical protein